MHLDKLLKWVNKHHINLDVNSRIEAKKMLDQKLVDAKYMIEQLKNDPENLAMFEDDKAEIEHALNLVNKKFIVKV